MDTKWRIPKIVAMAVYYDGNHEKKFDVGWTMDMSGEKVIPW